jgi:tetratricopeptide (TPR) repeat protein
MGWFFTQKGDLPKAAEWMENAVKQAPKDPRAHIGLANWSLQHGKMEDAKGHADTAGRLDPDSKELKLLRGLICRYEKDYTQAEKYLQALHQGSPGDFQTSNQLVLALIEQPDKTKRSRALQLAEANYRANPSSIEALATLGWVYYRLERLDDADRALQTCAASGNISAEVAFYLAHVMSDRGRADTAKQLLEAAVKAPGNFPYRKDAQEMLARLNKKP